MGPVAFRFIHSLASSLPSYYLSSIPDLTRRRALHDLGFPGCMQDDRAGCPSSRAGRSRMLKFTAVLALASGRACRKVFRPTVCEEIALSRTYFGATRGRV